MSDFRLFSARDKYPCRDFPDGICPKREPGCQDRCPEMIEAKKRNDERKALEKQRRNADMAAHVCIIELKNAATGNRPKER